MHGSSPGGDRPEFSTDADVCKDHDREGHDENDVRVDQLVDYAIGEGRPLLLTPEGFVTYSN